MQITISERCAKDAREFKELQEILQQPTDVVSSAEVRDQNQRNHDLAIRIAGAIADAMDTEQPQAVTKRNNTMFTAFTDGCDMEITGFIEACAAVFFSFGSTDIHLHFKTPAELIEFCEKHNIPFKDER